MRQHRLYVGTIGQGVFRSLDGGVSFRRACNGTFVECHVRALVVHPHRDHTLFLGSELGLFRSDDGADSWVQVESPINGKQVWSILIHPDNPDLMLAGTCPSQLFRSENGGKNWEEVSPDFRRECPRICWTRVTTLAADPANSSVLWAGVEIDGLWRSEDAGRTWARLGEGLSSQDIHALYVPPRRDGKRRLLAATNNDLNASDDEGKTWQPLGIGASLPHSYCRALAGRVDRPEVIFLGNGDSPPGTTGVLGVSWDAGYSWEPAGMPGPANSTIWNLAVHAAEPALIYASSVSGLIFRSADGGRTWSRQPREFGEIRALAWTP